jgi:hypothetical protein
MALFDVFGLRSDRTPLPTFTLTTDKKAAVAYAQQFFFGPHCCCFDEMRFSLGVRQQRPRQFCIVAFTER